MLRWLILIVGALPAVALGVPVGGATRTFAGGAGDQHDASLDAGQIAFTSRDASGTQVILGDLVSGALRTAAGPDAGEPELARNVLAYATPAGITLQFALTGATLRRPAEPGAAAPTVSATAAAWEVGPAGDRDIAWYQPLSGAAGVLAAAGDQRAPALAGNTLAYVDDAAGGTAVLYDLVRREARTASAAGVTGLAVDGVGDGLRLAVARAEAGGAADVEVWDGAGQRLAALPAPGEQRNPRLSGGWVAFEDLSSGKSVVVLWNWVADPVCAHVPRAAAAAQLLGDLAEGPDALTLAFSESGGADLDLLVHTVPLPAVDDGTGCEWPPVIPPARCDDAEAAVLATLLLARDAKEAQAGEVAFTSGDGLDLGVLLCLDAVGWGEMSVSLDGVLLAAPADFTHPSAHLERRTVARGGEGLVAATLSGAAGSALQVRVLADPAGTPPPPAADPGSGGGGEEPEEAPQAPGGVATAPPSGARPALGAASGCAAGPGGPLGLLALPLLLLVRRRRRDGSAPVC